MLGQYPEQGLRLFGKDAPAFTDADLATMHQPLDMFGVNIYSAAVARADENGRPEIVPGVRGYPMTMFRWSINPESLYWGPKFLSERYKLPVVITENGLASMDWVHADGKVHDSGRIDYLTRYLNELRRAIADGVDVRGYFQWSIDPRRDRVGHRPRCRNRHAPQPAAGRAAAPPRRRCAAPR